jgi:hypothetical protein
VSNVAKKANSFEALESIIKQVVIETVKNDLKDEAIKTVKEHIQSDVRNTYKPEVYERTYQLENSLIGNTHINNSGSQILLTIEHDENKMNYDSVMGYPVDGNELVNWIVSGDVYNLWSDDPSEAYLNPRPYMENAEEQLMSEIDSLIRVGISKRLK